MWLREVSKYGGDHLQSCTLIIGNKSDSSKRAITEADARSWVEQRNFLGYYETSCSKPNGKASISTIMDNIGFKFA